MVALAALVVAGSVMVADAVSNRAVVSEDLPNGTRVRIVQTFSGEPFETAHLLR